MKRIATTLLACALALPGYASPAADCAAATQPQAIRWASDFDDADAVESGREILGGGIISADHPWYDADTDDAKLVPVTVESESPFQWFYDFIDWMRGQSWNFSLFGMQFTFSLFQLVIGILILLGSALLIWVLTKVYRGRDVARAARTAGRTSLGGNLRRVEALPFNIGRRPADLLTEARQYYDSGDFNQAMIYLFSHQLVELDRNQVIHLAKGKTNRQYLREIARGRLPKAGDMKRLVEEAMVTFEDAFFGNHPIAQPRFEACWSQLNRFERLLGAETA